jgi:hypothetical protein
MAINSRPSYELAAGTHLITTSGGQLTFCSIIAAAADATVSCYDVQAAASISSANKIVAFKVDVSLNGFQGGGNITHPLKYTDGLCVVVAGTGALAYIGYIKG